MKLTIHVAPEGCDGWSGRIAAPDEGGTDGPLQSIAGARDRIRAIRKGGALSGPVEVLLHRGRYEQGETLFFTEEDLGTADTPVTYKAAGDGEVILAGSKRIQGFEPAGNGIWQAAMDEQGLKGVRFRQLFCDGARQTLARYPNFVPENPYDGGWLFVEGEVPEDVMGLYGTPKGVHDRFVCRDPRLKEWNCIGETEVFIFPRFNWVNDIRKVRSYDPASGEVVLDTPATYEICPGDRFYFRNAAEELDQPGEWYFDAGRELLYFYPPVDLADAVVSVPVVENIIVVDGAPLKYASYNDMLDQQGREMFHALDPRSVRAGYISFEGLTIEGCDGAGVIFRGVRSCSLRECIVRNTGMQGVRILGGAECSVVDCDIYETGSDGIAIRGGMRDEHEGNYTEAGHVACNNYIHHTGAFKKCSAGIALEGSGNKACNNLIHDCPRWGVLGVGNSQVIEYNHIHHVNLETSDTGAIYFCNRNFKMRGNKIRYNRIHDLSGHHLLGGKPLPPVITYGIYLDDYTSSTEVIGNITYRTPKGGVFIHDGQDNLVENNMFLDTKMELVTLLRNRPELEQRNMGVYGQAVRRNTFRRNILASALEGSTVYFLDTLFDENGRIDLDTNRFEDNMIWCSGRLVEVETHFYSRKISWEQWLELGYEKGSRVADPLFEDRERDDFRLKADSPAFGLGFEPIPVERIGLQPSPFRRK